MTDEGRTYNALVGVLSRDSIASSLLALEGQRKRPAARRDRCSGGRGGVCREACSRRAARQLSAALAQGGAQHGVVVEAESGRRPG
jgi:hypothetical protein